MINKHFKIAAFALLSLILFSCTIRDFESLPTYSDNHFIQAVIEIPAGTNHHIEYNSEYHRFSVAQIHGKEEIVHFLPAPGNYGFITSTCFKRDNMGHMEALDILVLGETIPTGSVMEVTLIGILTLKDHDGLDHKIIAVPADTNRRVIDADNLYGFEARFPMAKHLIEEWIVAVKSLDSVQVIGWQDELAAMQVINKWTIK